jgi:hypothetical protein
MLRALLVALSLLPLSAGLASADSYFGTSPGENPGGIDYEWEDETIGNEFTVDSGRILVRALGVWDEDEDGLANAYDLTLWTGTGTVLRTATVGSGTANPLSQGFRWASVAPLYLTVGETYVVGLYRPDFDDVMRWVDAGEVTIDGSFTLLDDLYVSGEAFPTNREDRDGIFGANFAFTPEPGTFVLTGLAGGGLLFLAARRRRRKRA